MDIKTFKKTLTPYKAILGIDYGSKRMGLAVSDLLLTIATSYKILYRKDISADLEELKKIIKEKEIGAIVMGLPLQMDGTEGEIAKEVKNFAKLLEENLLLPVFLWDERLTSSAVEKFLIKDFTGINSEYEEPQNADLVLYNDNAKECAIKIYEYIKERLFLCN